MSESLDRALATAGKEMMRKQYSPGLWAIALKMAQGNEEAARATYLDLRVPQLSEQYEEETRVREARHLARERHKAASAQERTIAKKSDGSEDTLGIAGTFFISLCALIFIGIMIWMINGNKGNFSTASNDPAWIEDQGTLKEIPINSSSNEQSEVQSDEIGGVEDQRSEEEATSASTSENGPEISQAQTYNPSFDCGNRLTNIEAMICQNEDLAIADRELSDRYFRIKDTVPKDLWADVRQSQREFLVSRSECLTVGCIRSSYIIQSDVLDRMTGGLGG